MRSNEIKLNQEVGPLGVPEATENKIDLIPTEILESISSRYKILGTIKDKVSAKFYDELGAKLGRERELVNTLLGIRERRQQTLAKYSLVLDQHYFEQKLL